MSSLRLSLVDALTGGRVGDATQILGALEDEATAALATGELAAITSIRGRLLRLRRAAAAVDSHWEGVQRMLALDRVLGSAITVLQLAMRREL